MRRRRRRRPEEDGGRRVFRADGAPGRIQKGCNVQESLWLRCFQDCSAFWLSGLEQADRNLSLWHSQTWRSPAIWTCTLPIWTGSAETNFCSFFAFAFFNDPRACFSNAVQTEPVLPGPECTGHSLWHIYSVGLLGAGRRQPTCLCAWRHGLQVACLTETSSSEHFHRGRKQRNQVENLPDVGGEALAILTWDIWKGYEWRALYITSIREAYQGRQMGMLNPTQVRTQLSSAIYSFEKSPRTTPHDSGIWALGCSSIQSVDAQGLGIQDSEHAPFRVAPATVWYQLSLKPSRKDLESSRIKQTFWKNGRFPLCRKNCGLLVALSQDAPGKKSGKWEDLGRNLAWRLTGRKFSEDAHTLPALCGTGYCHSQRALTLLNSEHHLPSLIWNLPHITEGLLCFYICAFVDSYLPSCPVSFFRAGPMLPIFCAPWHAQPSAPHKPFINSCRQWSWCQWWSDFLPYAGCCQMPQSWALTNFGWSLPWSPRWSYLLCRQE